MNNKKHLNALELEKAIHEASEILSNLKAQARRCDFYAQISSIRAVWSPLSEASRLVEVLNDREWPMDREDIRKVFDFSAFEYDVSHVDACNPDSVETIRNFLRQIDMGTA